MNSYEVITDQTKIFDNVKSYKYKVLKAMKVYIYTIFFSLLKSAVTNWV